MIAKVKEFHHLFSSKQLCLPSGLTGNKMQVPRVSPNPFEWADMLQQSSGASTSAQPNLEPHHLPRPHQMAPAGATEWTAAQPLFPEQDQATATTGSEQITEALGIAV